MKANFLSSTPSVVLLILAMIGLAIAILSDHLQIIAKYEGALRGRVAGGYNLAMKIMVLNRLGAAGYFLLISFNIDKGLTSGVLGPALSITVVSVSIPTALLLIWLQHRIDRNGEGGRVFDASTWPKSLLAAVFLATCCNLLGLTIPWIAGAAYPNLRLTLSNTSVLFNALFTAVNVFYIEHQFANLVDRGERNLYKFVAAVTVSRFASFLAIGAFIGVVQW